MRDDWGTGTENQRWLMAELERSFDQGRAHFSAAAIADEPHGVDGFPGWPGRDENSHGME
jgi:hypothetical protein